MADDQKKVEDDTHKFDFLQAKYLFRFPFTLTSIKWGFTLGVFFGLHAFIKNRSFNKAAQWFFWGTIMSTFPIWGFLMAKHTFYSQTIQKFEAEQIETMREAEMLKTYLKVKLGKHDYEEDEETLVEMFKKAQREQLKRNSQLDFLLENINEHTFD